MVYTKLNLTQLAEQFDEAGLRNFIDRVAKALPEGFEIELYINSSGYGMRLFQYIDDDFSGEYTPDIDSRKVGFAEELSQLVDEALRISQN